MADKEASGVRDAVKSGIAAMVIAAAGMVGASAGAYWFLMLIAVGVAIFLVVLYLRYRMKRFYRFVVWACLELLSLFLLVPSLRGAGVIGEHSRFVVVIDSLGSVAFVALCGLCGLAMIISAVVDCVKARGERDAESRGEVGKVKVRDEGIAPVAVGEGAVAEVRVDRLHHQSGGAAIGDVSEGATVIVGENVTVNIYYYVDGLPEAPNVEVRGLFEEGRQLCAGGKYREAIRGFEKCLGLEADQKKRGALGLQIGNCYYGMRQYVKAAEYYALGLRESREAGDPEGEASNLGSIANTYLERPAGTIASRGENVREAVKHYFAVLEIYKKDEYLVQYATTQNNLGNAYRDLPSATAEERAKNVRAAIDCYRVALEIYKKGKYAVDYAMTQNNLANVYTELPSATAEERAKNVRAAIDCCREALEIYKKDEYPVDYAMTQNNLGNVYRDLPSATAEERAKNVRVAIDCYREALEIFKKDEYPVEYAMTQNNLGNAYRHLPSGTGEKNVKAAINCYRAALEIRKKDEYPQFYCKTAANVGLLLASIDDGDACGWLKEAYALRAYLEDQGKCLEEVMEDLCKE